MLTEAVQNVSEGPYSEFRLTEDEWYELKIAAWLHDCGKVTTPVHIMDKATKLESIFDRMNAVRTRFEVLRRDARIRMLEAVAAGTPDARDRFDEEIVRLADDLAFLEGANIGGELLHDDAKARIRRIASRRYVEGGKQQNLLSDNEVENLCINRGTLTDEERLIINGHMVQTIQMLEALPFPKNLGRVP